MNFWQVSDIKVANILIYIMNKKCNDVLITVCIAALWIFSMKNDLFVELTDRCKYDRNSSLNFYAIHKIRDKYISYFNLICY